MPEPFPFIVTATFGAIFRPELGAHGIVSAKATGTFRGGGYRFHTVAERQGTTLTIRILIRQPVRVLWAHNTTPVPMVHPFRLRPEDREITVLNPYGEVVATFHLLDT